MTSAKTPGRISPKVEEELQEIYTRVQAPNSAVRLWNRILTDEDRARLGNDRVRAYKDGGTIGMWMRLRGVLQVRAIIEVARHLNFTDDGTEQWLLCETGQLFDNSEEGLDRASKSAELVLITSLPAAYWHGKKINIDWQKQRTLWDYFLTVCSRAKDGATTDSTHFGEAVNPNYPVKMKSRLINKPNFPIKLGDKIKSAGRGTQTLDLPRDQIQIWEIDASERLRTRQ